MQNWLEKLNEFLFKIAGSKSCSCDPVYYVKRSQNEFLMITVYVDGHSIGWNLLIASNKIESQLLSMSEMESSKEAKVCLEFGIFHDRKQKTLKILQTYYVDKVLVRFEKKDANPFSTSMQCQVEEIDIEY